MDSLDYPMSVCLTPINIMFLMKQPKFWLALCIALPCGCVGAGMAWMKDSFGEMLENIMKDEACYDTLTLLVTLVAAFRIQVAYMKFWDGCDLSYNIVGDLFDATAHLMAFCRNSKADAKTVDDFQQVLVRLMSILNSLIFAELESGVTRKPTPDTDDEAALPVSYNFELIDVAAIDGESMEMLYKAENKVEMVYQWIQNLCMEAWRDNVFSVPGPILNRGLQNVGSGIAHFHEAQKITEVPFPFPYMIALQTLLVTHWMITPIMCAQWSNYMAFVFLFCFFGTFSLWFFVAVAVELDQPFNQSRNSIDMRYLQRLLNNRLLTLMEMSTVPTIYLKKDAVVLTRLNHEDDEELSKGLVDTVAFSRHTVARNTAFGNRSSQEE